MSKCSVFLFPGQGSQSPGMLKTIAEQSPLVLETFNEASDALGYNLWHLVQHEESRLNLTQFTQPAILTASVALWRIFLEEMDVEVQGMAGHSLGEYSALVCAESLSLQEGVKLVAKRGELMQSAVPEGIGAMIAVLGLEDEQVAEVCHKVSTEDCLVTPANYNAPGQVVVAGHKAAAKTFIEAAKSAGARKVVPLPMSVPSHCVLMKPAQDEFAQALSEIKWHMPKYQILQNAQANLNSRAASIDELVDNLKQQLCKPVPWVKMMQHLIDDGVEDFYECGPGQILCGLMKRIDRSVNIASIEKMLQNNEE